MIWFTGTGIAQLPCVLHPTLVLCTMRTRRRVRVLPKTPPACQLWRPSNFGRSDRMSSEPPRRRSPVQERSQGTVQRVLSAASSLLAGGAAGGGADHRADRRGRRPVGGRAVPLLPGQAGDRRCHRGAAHGFVPGTALPAPSWPPCRQDAPGFLGMVIDAFVAYLETNPDFRILAFGARRQRTLCQPAARATTMPGRRWPRPSRTSWPRRSTSKRRTASFAPAHRHRNRRPPAGLRVRTGRCGRTRPYHRRSQVPAWRLSVRAVSS